MSLINLPAVPSEFFKLVVIEFKLFTSEFKFIVIELMSSVLRESVMLFILLLADLKSARLFVKFSELLAINLEISSDVSERLLVKFEKSSILDFS